MQVRYAWGLQSNRNLFTNTIIKMSAVLEFQNNLWGLGTLVEKGLSYIGYIGSRNRSLGIDTWAPQNFQTILSKEWAYFSSSCSYYMVRFQLTTWQLPLRFPITTQARVSAWFGSPYGRGRGDLTLKIRTTQGGGRRRIFTHQFFYTTRP